jgi:hypothetical protein
MIAEKIDEEDKNSQDSDDDNGLVSGDKTKRN